MQTVMNVFEGYGSFFDALRDVGVPLVSTGENGECDGTKLLKGYYEGFLQKGRFLHSKGRGGLGDLDKPTTVLLTGCSPHPPHVPTGIWVKIPRLEREP